VVQVPPLVGVAHHLAKHRAPLEVVQRLCHRHEMWRHGEHVTAAEEPQQAPPYTHLLLPK
jgi:hypothetical protein